jgi:hypothetical protein
VFRFDIIKYACKYYYYYYYYFLVSPSNVALTVVIKINEWNLIWQNKNLSFLVVVEENMVPLKVPSPVVSLFGCV